MSKEVTPSAKSSCCGADVLPPGGIRKNPRESEMMKIVCDACGTESCWNGIAYCEKYRTAGIKKVPINCKHVPVQPAPGEGEMEKPTVGIDLASGSDRSCVSLAQQDDDGHFAIIANEYVSNELAAFIQKQDVLLRSIQSRLKQAEAERDSYRGDAERMMYTLRIYRSVNFEGSGVWAEECLSSLSNQYPSTK